MDDIRRSLEAMEIDEDINLVVMRSKTGNVFSLGTDLNTLYYAKSSGDKVAIDKYFEKLYNFLNFIAIYHKPMFLQGTGQASIN